MATQSSFLNPPKPPGGKMQQHDANTTATDQKVFPFVSYDGPGVRDRKVLRNIRKHVMVPIAQQRREKNQAKRLQEVSQFKILGSSNNSTPPFNSQAFGRSNDASDSQGIPNVQSCGTVGSGRVDETRFNYPAGLKHHGLTFLDEFPHFFTAAAFDRNLSSENNYLQSNELARRRSNIVSIEEWVLYQSFGTRIINKLMSEQKFITSDGMVRAVIGLAFHAHILRDDNTCHVHMNGLSKIVALRGGIETLKANKIMYVTLGWLDINVSATHDLKPTWPLIAEFQLKPFPTNLTPSPTTLRITILLQKLFPTLQICSICQIFQNLDSLYQQLLNEGNRTSGGASRQQTFIVSYINPLIYELLNIRYPVHVDNSGSVILQACRLAILLSLATTKRLLGPYTVCSAVMVSKLCNLPTSDTIWEGLEDLEIWIISIALIESVDEAQRRQFWRVWNLKTQWLGLSTFEEVEALLRRLPWIDSIHGEKLRGTICTILFEQK